MEIEFIAEVGHGSEVGVHAVDPVDSEYTLCGLGLTAYWFKWAETNSSTVTCGRCAEIIEAMRNVHCEGKTNPDELAEALVLMMRAYEQLIPGIKHIACSDYAIVNEAPLAARKALADAGIKLP